MIYKERNKGEQDLNYDTKKWKVEGISEILDDIR